MDKERPITPPKGEPMPQTREYWEKRAEMDQELILEQKEEIAWLKQRINKLEQKKSRIKALEDALREALEWNWIEHQEALDAEEESIIQDVADRIEAVLGDKSESPDA